MAEPPHLETPLNEPVFLLAMPQVLDPNFFRSVVLLVRHEDEGSLGFIVNRPTGTPLTQILADMRIEWWGDEEALAHLGGPVQPQIGSVVFIPAEDQGMEGEATVEILPGVGLTQHVGDLQRLAHAPPADFRLFLGYAAWGSGQLMDEILRNDWIIAPVDRHLIFTRKPDQVWGDALRSVGIDPDSLPSWTAGVDEDVN